MMKRTVLFLCVGAAFLTLQSPVILAQGGPPFRSDDPDTPGSNNWEINVGFIGDRNPVAGTYATPNIDVNYGIGHRIQLKYELPLSIREIQGGNGHVAAGLGNSLLGVKYRFYAHHPKAKKKSPAGERESNFGLSVYPQLLLNNPTRSVSREIAELGPQFLLPLEANAKIGGIRISAEVGYWFTNRKVPNSWIRGVVVGHEFKRKQELFLELYDQADVKSTPADAHARESTFGLGTRLPIATGESVRLIGMVGRSLVTVTPANGQPSWIAYVGVQFLVGAKRHSSDYIENGE
jgi:hypothetical protein